MTISKCPMCYNTMKIIKRGSVEVSPFGDLILSGWEIEGGTIEHFIQYATRNETHKFHKVIFR